jgi:hypothetical protein
MIGSSLYFFGPGRKRVMNNVKNPDWNHFPQDFRYLVDVTKTFGTRSIDPAHFHPTQEEMDLLAITSRKIRLNGGYERIMNWVFDHQEFWVVGYVLTLITFIGFDLSRQE